MDAIVARDGPNCWVCGQYVYEFNRSADHVLERQQGGRDKLENLKLACKPCNVIRSANPDLVPEHARPIRNNIEK